jgi:threonine/homoserine/homoserine lactone efflux protein
MPDASTLAVFAAAALLLAVMPGPAVLYIVSRSVEQGRSAGLVSALGVATGGTVHMVAAAVGLSSLLLASATAFTAVKYVGAAYLVYLGVRTLVRRESLGQLGRARNHSRRRIYTEGVVVNILNPKTALFFFAFLPQFVDPDGVAPAVQMAVLGAIFVTLALASDSLWALAAGTVAHRLTRSERLQTWRRRLSGAVLIGLGVTAALAEPRRN